MKTNTLNKNGHIRYLQLTSILCTAVLCGMAQLLPTGVALGGTDEDAAIIIELPFGYIIGAHADGKWLPSEQAGKTLKPGGKYSLFNLTGKLGQATGGKAAPDADVCPDVWLQEISPPSGQDGIAVDAAWNPMPRTARASDVTQEVYIQAVRDFLVGKGIGNPLVKITRILHVDLDGDGVLEALLSATNYPGKAGTSPHSAMAGNYSFVILRHVVNGKVQTRLIEGEFYPKKEDSGAPNRHEVLGLLDLDGDGVLEIIIQSVYYEGGATSVWRFKGGKLERVLQMACGA